LSTAGSPGAKSSEFSLTEQTSNGFDDLFADVAAVPLTDEEADQVEGQGPVGAVIAGVVLSVWNPGLAAEKAVYNYQSQPKSGFSESRATMNSKAVNAVVTAAIIVAGNLLPF
jgi:hypothetical protein